VLDFVGLLLTAVVYEDLVHLRLVRGVYLRLVSCIGNNNIEARRTSTIELMHCTFGFVLAVSISPG
jgi:hypothetical protein